VVGLSPRQRRPAGVAGVVAGRNAARPARRRRLAAPVSDAASLEAFLDKWRARWPEWRIAEVFVPAPRRPATLAWLGLRQELADAAWGGADPRPGAAKLAWWSDELRGWASGRRRHPLGL